MNGSIVANPISENCSGNQNSRAEIAKEALNTFISGGQAKQQIIDFYDAAAPLANVKRPLNDVLTNLKTKSCNPSIDFNNTKNNERIDFSVEMGSCVGGPQEDGNVYYSSNETTSSSKNWDKDCFEQDIMITSSVSSKSVEAKCGMPINEFGQFEKFDSISSIGPPSNPPYKGNRSSDNDLRTTTYSYAPYQGTKDWTITFNDKQDEENCAPKNNEGCFKFKVQETTDNPIKRHVNQNTCKGNVTQEKGETATRKNVSISLIPSDACDYNFDSVKSALIAEAKKNKPNCIIENLNWSVSFDGKTFNGNASIGGVDS